MAAQIISLAQRLRPSAPRDWSPQEIAEFYRVESALVQAGLLLETERGLSDEGDPWFVFCRADTGEVFIHFARVDGEYVVDGAALPSARGHDFSALVRDLIGRHPLASARRAGSNVFLHPAALLVALVGAAFFHTSQAKAAEPTLAEKAGAPRPEPRRGLTLNTGGPALPELLCAEGRFVALDAAQVATVLAAVAIAVRQPELPAAASFERRTNSEAGTVLAAETPAAASGKTGALLTARSEEVRAALLVMAVLRELAAPNADPAPGPGEGDTTPLALSLGVEVMSPPVALVGGAAPPAEAAAAAPLAPVLVVRLVEGPLPEIAAVALVLADGALAGVSPDRVAHVDQLPALLADLISRGELVLPGPALSAPVAADTPPPPVEDAASLPPPSPPAHDDNAPAPDVVAAPEAAAPASEAAAPAAPPEAPAPPPVLEAVTPPVVVAPPAPPVVTPPPPVSVIPPAPPVAVVPPAPPVATPPTPVDAPPAHSPLIDAAVRDFIAKVEHVSVVVTGREVVFYDARIFGALPAGETMDAVTFKLEDGSSVSLVGTASELHGLHGLG